MFVPLNFFRREFRCVLSIFLRFSKHHKYPLRNRGRHRAISYKIGYGYDKSMPFSLIPGVFPYMGYTKRLYEGVPFSLS